MVRTMTGTVLKWEEKEGEYFAPSVADEVYSIGRPASSWNLTTPRGEVLTFDTLEAAMAAAQGDFAKASPALTASASEPEPVAKLDWSNFEDLKLNTSWRPQLQELIWTAMLHLDHEGDADEDAGEQIIERLLLALRTALAHPVPTPDGAVEARQGLSEEMLARAWDVFRDKSAEGSQIVALSHAIAAALETPWQKPGRAAQAQAGEKPDFPADEQSGETSHGAVTDALERYRAQEPFGGDMVSNPQGTWVRFDDAMAKIAALSVAQAPAQQGVTDDRIERACRIHNVGWSLWPEPQKKTAREVMRLALAAALSHPADGWRDIESSVECHGLDTPERVCFYEQDFYVLSNFSSFGVSWGPYSFPTSEHLYHWRRFFLAAHAAADKIADQIFHAKSAHEAFKIAPAAKPEGE